MAAEGPEMGFNRSKQVKEAAAAGGDATADADAES